MTRAGKMLRGSRRVARIRTAPAMVLALSLGAVPQRAAAETVLTVDLEKPIRPVTHSASGSLYGVTEALPADVNALIAPLKPNVLVNPAANVQQPVGDAIAVAGRVAPVGGRVTIRLADLFPRWPYAFTNVDDWLKKVANTVARKQASGLDNYYGYEIWNEPDGTWKSSLPFNDFWKQTYVKLRQLDPTAKLIGPSISWYNSAYLKSFLTYAKANDCLPDIVAWHELSGADLTSNFTNYRALEKELGIGPLPISINEYSGKDRINDEGQPGASAPMIAKFERFEVDSACISFWDVPHPGRLGSLLATDTRKNGGWWFYKWYGDMRGVMVTTAPASPHDAAALDGFANLDAAQERASVLFAGVNDGTIRIVVKGFQSAPYFGSKVHAVVERAPFANRSTAVDAPDLLSATDVSVADDQIAITVDRASATAGYRLSLSPVESDGGTSMGPPLEDAGVADLDAATLSPADASSGGMTMGSTSALDAGALKPDAGLGDAGHRPEIPDASRGVGPLASAPDSGALASLDAGYVDGGGADDGGCSVRAARTGRTPWWVFLPGLLGMLARGRRRRRAGAV